MTQETFSVEEIQSYFRHMRPDEKIECEKYGWLGKGICALLGKSWMADRSREELKKIYEREFEISEEVAYLP